jgi:hypothetical protein
MQKLILRAVLYVREVWSLSIREESVTTAAKNKTLGGSVRGVDELVN